MTKPEQDGPDLAGLLPLLAALPAPELPAQVAARLDAAIARAVAERVESDGRTVVPAPQRASQGLWRRRLRSLALASGATCLVLVVGLAIALGLRGSGSDGGRAGASAGGPAIAALSTAPVTDPQLLSLAAAALQNRPAHNGEVVRPGFSNLATPGPQTTAPSAGATTGSDVTACLSAGPLFEPAMEQRQLLSSASGEYNGQSAILLVYSNGSDTSTAYVVVFAAPCHGQYSSVLSSGVVPR